MRAVVLDDPGNLHLATMAYPSAPGPTEAIIRIKQVGVCGTDYHAYHGNQPFFSYPRVLGHELGVEIVALGASVRRTPGWRKVRGAPISQLRSLSSLLTRQTKLLPEDSSPRCPY